MAFKTWVMTALVGLANGLASTDTITWGGDNSRAGYQTNHNMDPSVVGSSQFGQLFRTLLPGSYGNVPEQIFSQPLVYTPDGDSTQYVYVATTQNNVYKINAKTGSIVASRNLAIPFLSLDLSGCYDIEPHVGVTSTGVIDATTNTLYLTSKTYVDQTLTGVAQGRPAGRYYLHALDVNDLSEKPNFPVNLEGIVAKNNPIRSFNGGIHHQRPALLHVGNYIYAGFASHCVQYNFTGWIMGFDKTSGANVERFATEGDGVPVDVKGGGVWMSGGGLASDDAGSLFYATGNGYASQLSTIPVNGRTPPTSLEEAAVHMTINDDGSLSLVDFFMPWEKQALDGADKDLGTSPLQILPSTFSCGDVKRIGVVTGKSGKTYWLNLDDLGGYRNGANGLDDVIQVYQNENSVYAGAGVYPGEGGYIYINVIQYPTHVFKFSCEAGVPSFTKVADSPQNNAYILGVSHGTVTTLNGQAGTGLLWTLDVQGSQLKIFEAVPKDGYLNMIKSFSVPGSTKFTRAVFGDGIMYQGTTQGYLYAFGSPVTTPINCTATNEFGVVNVGSQSDPRTITCTAVIGVTVSDVGLDEAEDFTLSGVPTLPLTLTAGQTFTIGASFKPTTVGLVSSDIVVNTTNTAEGYSQGTHIRLTGTGESAGPLLSITPPTITFQGVIAGQEGGTDESVILSNQGNSALSITDVQFSTTSAQGPFTSWDRATASLTVGKFTLTNVPATIPANTAVTVRIAFDSSVSGTFGAYLQVVSDGGTKAFTIAGSAGPAPVALVEFQTPDGTGWVEYDAAKNFTFGNVTENTSRALKFRVTNNATEGGVKLSLTVSKPPFGIDGIIQAANLVDLAEGTILAPGESATATLICTVPKAQWNTDSYSGTAPWTMNTNDPNFEKHFFTFECTAVAEQAPPLLGDGQGKYRYIGCYKENNPGRQLANQLYGDDTSTNAKCIAACAEKAYVFCGTQYHTECWGGPKIPTEKVDERNCNFDCGGDLNQICGGNGFGANEGGAYISVFADSVQWDGNTTTPTPNPDPSGPEVNPGVGQYVSEGCYTEPADTRALPNLVTTTGKTVALCIETCAASRYTYIGLEYGGECWCGNTLATGSVPADAADCSMPCADNSTEYCGGSSRLNLYKLDGTLPEPTNAVPTGATTTTSAAPTSTAPPANERVGDWLFQGCYTEGTGVRALSSRTYANDSMTLESCGAFCEGLAYFGTEYGRECWCGDEFGTGSALAANQKDCSFPCAGDSTQFCGAGDRLQVYLYSPVSANTPTEATTTASAFASLVVPSNETATSTATETTPADKQGSPTGSTSSTTAFFTASNSTISSAQVTAETVVATLSASNSSIPATAKASTTSSTTSTTSLLSTSALNSTFSPTLEQVTTSPATLATSSASATALSNSTVPATSSTSTTSSALATSSAPATSSVPPTSSVLATSSAPSTSTSSTTTSTSSATPTPTGPVISTGNENFTYYGCFSEPQVGRLLPAQIINRENMTIGMCLSACYDKNYAGVEYGRECWCGDALNLGGSDGSTPAANVTAKDCSFTCPGNSTEYCGAGVRLSLYILKDELEKLQQSNATISFKS
ncbi:WSC domain-containing protein [Colletotrichum orchidophilum]|uniref:WSC domain-containing protein n=1 Tax=Colletotrichum orchidophilum TaxID=1209926 RepID=A0A1G4BKH4_9PEZI|nr:WSC domain-containing protein [Colletotrichum orchidophilum]OHF01835.1 WSC domain-containing protein [Colletotrichum orchidophilum]